MITIWLQNNDTLRNKICQGEEIGKFLPSLLNIVEKTHHELCKTYKALRHITEEIENRQELSYWNSLKKTIEIGILLLIKGEFL